MNSMTPVNFKLVPYFVIALILVACSSNTPKDQFVKPGNEDKTADNKTDWPDSKKVCKWKYLNRGDSRATKVCASKSQWESLKERDKTRRSNEQLNWSGG